jgi:hypothetical protein
VYWSVRLCAWKIYELEIKHQKLGTDPKLAALQTRQMFKDSAVIYHCMKMNPESSTGFFTLAVKPTIHNQ